MSLDQKVGMSCLQIIKDWVYDSWNAIDVQELQALVRFQNRFETVISNLLTLGQLKMLQVRRCLADVYQCDVRNTKTTEL